MKCSKCQVNRSITLFKKNGKVLKSCSLCRGENVANKKDENYSTYSPDESSTDIESVSDETQLSDSDSSEDESIYCPACKKTFDNQTIASKHSKTPTHIKNWEKYQQN
jgi:uncharacterized Zn finger protein (UPF0148 family)